MCLGVFRDAGKAFQEAAKKKSMPHTVAALVGSGIMAGLAVLLVMARTSSIGSSVMFAFNILVLIIGIGIIAGYIIKTIMTALGGKGKFFEGLTAISYGLMPLTTGLLALALLSFIPAVGVAFGMIALMVLVALGLAVVYRGIKELFKVDMITAFVGVSIMTIAFIIGMYASLGLASLASFGQMIPLG